MIQQTRNEVFRAKSPPSAGFGALTLTATGSKLDFGTGTVGILSFASVTPSTAGDFYTLTIDNWTGAANTVGSALTDRLIFSGTQSANLSYFSFTGYNGATEFSLGNGLYEVAPVTPVPEPSTYAAAALAAAVVGWQLLRRRRQRVGER